jgi:BirA family transcriptional regulator, biotin operon repressor / biotin---[acetyl-CoA-carboxylase] ligase
MDYVKIPVNIIHLDTVDSTNNYIANLFQANNISFGTVVLADEQTAGRGQRGTKWQSSIGENLLSSLFVQWKSIAFQEQFKISMLVAIGICRYLQDLGIEAQIKWPNDILVNRKKICGTLIENQSQNGQISSSIIGIGMNVNQTIFADDIQAISLSQCLDKQHNVKFVAIQLYHIIGATIQQYLNYPYEWIERTYCAFLYGYNSFVDVIDLAHNEVINVFIEGVEPSGLLRVKTRFNRVRLVDLKEIRFLLE